jgi:HK97 gp10 family phage protein
MSVKVIGLDKALADLDKKGDDVIEAVKDALSSAATDIEIDAIRNAPSQWNGLPLNIKQRIDKVSDDGGLSWKVGIQSGDPVFEIEAWLEFGTGLSAKQILSNPVYTQEVRDVARRFYRNGRGRIIGQPFLMPAFFRNTANLVSDIEAEINKDI